MHWRVSVNLLSFLLICVLPLARMQVQINPSSDVEKQLIDILDARSVRYDWRRSKRKSKCLRGKLRCSMPCYLPSCRPCPACPGGPALPPEQYLSGSYLPAVLVPPPEGYQAAIFPAPNVVVVSQPKPMPVLLPQPNPSQSPPINILNDVPLNKEQNPESPAVVAMSSSSSQVSLN